MSMYPGWFIDTINQPLHMGPEKHTTLLAEIQDTKPLELTVAKTSTSGRSKIPINGNWSTTNSGLQID